MEAYGRGQTPVSGGTMPVPGHVIADKYRIEEVIGRGGMSVVYRATHLQLDQQVAIKVLSAEALLLPEYVVRLNREARAVSRIRSEHVVRVHDIGELPDGAVPYLVMEFLSGFDLAAVLARHGTLPIPLAVECLLQACEALVEAHALGIVHRDLKPANLFLTEAADGSPCVKLLDFGISRMARRHGLSSLTDPGTVLGTPSYMAPEQMEAASTVDARSDIWALGAILHELLVGKPPYTGESLPQIFVKIMRSKAPKPSTRRRDVPASIDSIVARCLKIEPNDRFQSVAELAWALSTVGTASSRESAARIARVLDKHVAAEISAERTLRSSAPPPVAGVAARRRRPPGRLVAVLAGAALLSVAAVSAVLAAGGAMEAGAAEVPEQAPATEAAPALDDAALGFAPALRSRDGAPSVAAGVVRVVNVRALSPAAPAVVGPRPAAVAAGPDLTSKREVPTSGGGPD